MQPKHLLAKQGKEHPQKQSVQALRLFPQGGPGAATVFRKAALPRVPAWLSTLTSAGPRGPFSHTALVHQLSAPSEATGGKLCPVLSPCCGAAGEMQEGKASHLVPGKQHGTLNLHPGLGSRPWHLLPDCTLALEMPPLSHPKPMCPLLPHDTQEE